MTRRILVLANRPASCGTCMHFEVCVTFCVRPPHRKNVPHSKKLCIVSSPSPYCLYIMYRSNIARVIYTEMLCYF